LSRDPTEGFEDDLAAQVEFVSPRAPACGRLLEALSTALDEPLRARLREAWAGRRFGAWYERPLLLLASVRDDALREGPGHPLWQAIQVADPDPEAATDAAVAAALAPDRRHLWSSLAGRSLQTNDPTRAIAWILPAAIAAAADPDRPLGLFEIGCSGGLNLVADRLPMEWTRSDGAALRLEPLPPVERRAGFDLRPVDVLDEDGARWLRASVWPGQRERGRRLEAAIDAFRALADRGAAPTIERLTAADIPARLPRLDASSPRAIAFQSIVRDYLPEEGRRRYEEGMRRWLGACPPGAAVWAELEVTETAREGGPPVELVAHTSDGDEIATWPLAHSDPHPTEITVVDDACAALRAALG
jgi:hypothetical protein